MLDDGPLLEKFVAKKATLSFLDHHKYLATGVVPATKAPHFLVMTACDVSFIKSSISRAYRKFERRMMKFKAGEKLSKDELSQLDLLMNMSAKISQTRLDIFVSQENIPSPHRKKTSSPKKAKSPPVHKSKFRMSIGLSN